jgi:hypothetical protein
LLRRRSSRQRWRAELFNEYTRTLASLYRSLANATGSRVIVDSSKLPSYLAALAAVDSVEVSVVHLIRDPRAVAYSWTRGSSNPGPIDRTGMAKSSLNWNLFNAGAEAVSRSHGLPYLRLQYEELVDSPASALERILAFSGEDTDYTPLSGPRTALVSPTHTVSGNPARFRSGSIEIERDTRWFAGMPAVEKHAVALMTLPLLLRYGYSPAPRGGTERTRTAHA